MLQVTVRGVRAPRHRREHVYYYYRCLDCGTQFRSVTLPRLKEKCQYGSMVQAVALSLLDTVNAAVNKTGMFLAGLTQTWDVESTLEVLHRHGYYRMTEDFLLLVRGNAMHLCEDALLTPEELKEFSGNSFFERCRKSINLIFALSSIAGLALGVSGVADPALLIAIAGGVSLILGIDHIKEP